MMSCALFGSRVDADDVVASWHLPLPSCVLPAADSAPILPGAGCFGAWLLHRVPIASGGCACCWVLCSGAGRLEAFES